MQMQEKVDPGINDQLSKMINQLMFKKEKPDEEKLKEKLSHITRPANCDSLVTTNVDELIWQRLRPQTRSFDSKAQVAQTCCQVSHNPSKNARKSIEFKRQVARLD